MILLCQDFVPPVRQQTVMLHTIRLCCFCENDENCERKPITINSQTVSGSISGIRIPGNYLRSILPFFNAEW